MKVGALSGLALDDDLPAALLHDAVDRRQAEARSLPELLRREEGLEEAALQLRGNAAPGIRDRDRDLRPQFLPGGLVEVHGFRGVEVPGADRDPTAVRHGVARIQREVHDDVLELAGVHLHPARARGIVRRELDVLAGETAEHRLDPGDDEVNVDEPGLEDLLAAEGEKLPRQGSGALARLADVGQRAAPRVVRFRFEKQEVGVSGDDRQEVVEVVGDSARELADRIQLLPLAELLLEVQALGDVPGRRVHEALVADHDDGVVELGCDPGAVLPPNCRRREDPLALQDAPVEGAERREIGLVVEVGNFHRQQLFAGEAGELRRRAVDGDEPPLLVTQEHGVARALEDLPLPFQRLLELGVETGDVRLGLLALRDFLESHPNP